MQDVLDYSVAVQAVSATELLTTDEAKLHSRVVIDAEDDEIAAAIKRARIQVEKDTRRSLIQHTYDFKYDCFPSERLIRFTGYTPLSSVTHLKYIDTNGTLQTWSSANYEVDTARDAIWLAFNIDWPPIREIQNAVQIRAVFGHASTDEDLEYAKQAVQLLVTDWYERRGSVVVGPNATELPFAYTSIVERLMKRSYP